MGSVLSSQSVDSGSFSIDPSGNITPTKKRPQNSTSQDQNINQGHHESGLDSSHVVDELAATTGAITGKDNTSHMQQTQLASSDNMPSRHDDLSLQEADEIVTQMKLKYKDDSAEHAGKNKAAFEDIERRLVHCYRIHKDQPINCLELTKQYSRIVEEHRSRLLRTTLDVPPVS